MLDILCLMSHITPIYEDIPYFKNYDGSWSACGNLMAAPIDNPSGGSSRTIYPKPWRIR